jgi:(E)-4-hydroxy-3-methylbut-2-enyl-diphosphate synthase
MIIKRFPTKEIFLGKVGIGGTNPISIQSMTTTTTSDIKATLAQIEALRQNGADIVRVAVLSKTDSEALEDLVKESPIPLVADIHFNAAFALKALKARIPGLRLNPGNIKDPKDVKEIINAAKEYNPAIRIGVNGGSLDKNLYPEDSAQNIVKSALEHIKILEKEGFTNIKVSLKSTDVLKTVEAYELFTKERDYPPSPGYYRGGRCFYK